MERIYLPAEAFAERVAERLVTTVRQGLQEQSTFSLVLCGGNTPRALYQRLAEADPEPPLWTRVHFFWGDERYVPHSSPSSNYQMAYSLWLSRLPIAPSHLHPMPTDCPEPDECARRYEQHLRALFPDAPYPRFDLILLGMGEEGHTASLFPGDSAVEERERWVAVGHAPVEPRMRLTLTLSVLNSARRVWFLVTGTNKREAIRKVFSGVPLPAGLVRPTEGELIWWLDETLKTGQEG